LRDFDSFATTFPVLKIVWTLGDVVRKLREQRDWTQGELGERADIHQTVIGRLENNSDKSERATVERVARALNVSVSDLHLFVEEATLSAELSDGERRAVMDYQRRLIAKRPQGSAPAVESRSDLPVPTRESPAQDRKRRRG
jgi:transcriptional regulator with XRE-family HTH domain